MLVAPYVGAWIETMEIHGGLESTRSLPTWERGLKQLSTASKAVGAIVAPYVGAWIETASQTSEVSNHFVAPYVGAWIETNVLMLQNSPLSVAPYVGAWIETRPDRVYLPVAPGRSLRGSVD